MFAPSIAGVGVSKGVGLWVGGNGRRTVLAFVAVAQEGEKGEHAVLGFAADGAEQGDVDDH